VSGDSAPSVLNVGTMWRKTKGGLGPPSLLFKVYEALSLHDKAAQGWS